MFRLNACVLEMPEDLPGSKTRQGREAKTIPISKHLAKHMAGWGVRQGKVAGLNGVASQNWKAVWDRVALLNTMRRRGAIYKCAIEANRQRLSARPLSQD